MLPGTSSALTEAWLVIALGSHSPIKSEMANAARDAFRETLQ